jgi:hypothetical protein
MSEPHRREHELKTWPEFFDALLSGAKTFEYRRDDRGFRVGDVLCLREWDPQTQDYSGREMRRSVTYLLQTDISGEFVVMALAHATATDQQAENRIDPWHDVFEHDYWCPDLSPLKWVLLEKVRALLAVERQQHAVELARRQIVIDECVRALEDMSDQLRRR